MRKARGKSNETKQTILFQKARYRNRTFSAARNHHFWRLAGESILIRIDLSAQWPALVEGGELACRRRQAGKLRCGRLLVLLDQRLRSK